MGTDCQCNLMSGAAGKRPGENACQKSSLEEDFRNYRCEDTIKAFGRVS
jgi:hypothetical protein